MHTADATYARAHEPRPRPFALSIPSQTPRYWMAGDPFASHLMNVLSFMFPGGERFFIESVRAFQDRITDPQLRAQVKAFIAQEGAHTREHMIMNRWHARHGVDGAAAEAESTAVTKAGQARRSAEANLAVTCALEHFTALLAEAWLTTPALREAAAEPLRSLWIWHAIEELDHKSVAFDVYQAVSGDHASRVFWMAVTTLEFVVGTGVYHLMTLAKDGQLKQPHKVMARWLDFWGPRGHFTRLIPGYLRYFRRDFHPAQEDHRALIARFEGELAAAAHAA
jgi:uncharacterized protein